MPKTLEGPHYPIVYVRGYAGSQSEVEDTVATPYMGFNLGSTKVRQTWDGRIQRLVFESPLVRLMKDHGYRDLYSEGAELPLDEAADPKSVVIFRYYDDTSEDLGTGQRHEIERHAGELSHLIARLRTQVCERGGYDPRSFRVYLVAHSMGGLIVRAFLQNPALDPAKTRDRVDKAFTYATPHGGIDVKVLGNLPSWLRLNNMNNFSHDRMRKFLKLPKTRDGREVAVNTLTGPLPHDRFFCLVGTDSSDYGAAGGLAKRLVGPMSDGLVRIENASVRSAPRAFVHRSHSGHFGIVNSEEGYQNLVRFLFGQVRVDGILHVEELTLPDEVHALWVQGKRVRASYHFETVVRVRGARYDLHRRLTSEGSAILRAFDDLFEMKRRGRGPKVAVPRDDARSPHLFSSYLDGRQRTKGTRTSPLVFAVDLRVKVPDYEVDGSFLRTSHFEGAHLFDQTIVLSAVPPKDGAPWSVRYEFDPFEPGRPEDAEVWTGGQSTPRTGPHGELYFLVPLQSRRAGNPRMTATLELVARPWS